MSYGFAMFGAGHLAVIAVTVAVAFLLARVARALAPVGRARLFRALAAALVALTAAYFAHEHAAGTLDWTDLVPLHICDFSIVLAIVALLTGFGPARELLYFWALAGTSLAIITPDVADPLPSSSTLFYFTLHGAVVVSAIVTTWGARAYPSPRAPWRVLLFTNIYAGVVALVNTITGANFLYLSRKPAGSTLVDYFGPWPIYILVGEVVALALFLAIGRLTPTER